MKNQSAGIFRERIIQKYIFPLRGLQAKDSYWFKIGFLVNELVVKILYHKSFIKIEKYAAKFRAYDEITVQMRTIGESHLDDLFELFNKEIPETTRESVIFFKQDILSLRKMLRSRSCTFIGLFKDGELIGCTMLKFLMTRDVFMLFVVSRTWRGRGLGRILVGACVNLMRELKFRTYCTTDKATAASINMLKKEDFVKVGEDQNRYIFAQP